MYAIIETGGKQYRVENGDVIYVEKLNAEENAEITFDKVVAVCNKKLKVGKPYVKDTVVKGVVLKNGKGKKINIFTYKPKKGSARHMGHRQPYTKVQISEIAKND
ncbi:MAG: 50S ribosomal protein L21 [Clostridia bacterium]|nr:50S ribosomal protein L21 [Oscillospiraceae bacterium]MBR6694516.1 50S ribosomal protein L21 [Clostridia bacterium]